MSTGIISQKPFSKVNIGSGAQMTAVEIRAYIRGLKSYIAEYPWDEDKVIAIREEIERWRAVLKSHKMVKPFKI